VTPTSATISWGTNNSNPSGTTYSLYYQELIGDDIENESHWSNWSLIPIDGSDQTTKLTTTQDIFEQNKTYRLKVEVHHVAGTSYNVASDYVVFTTSTDPAVRAAQEAAIAAQAAKKAAEDSVQYSLDAKQSADSAVQILHHQEYGLEKIYNKIKTVEDKVANFTFPPTVEKLTGANNATATTDNRMLLYFIVDNANVCRYKVNNGDYSDWLNIEGQDHILVELGNDTGIKNITVQFALGIIDEYGNVSLISPTKTTGIAVFKL